MERKLYRNKNLDDVKTFNFHKFTLIYLCMLSLEINQQITHTEHVHK